MSKRKQKIIEFNAKHHRKLTLFFAFLNLTIGLIGAFYFTSKIYVLNLFLSGFGFSEWLNAKTIKELRKILDLSIALNQTMRKHLFQLQGMLGFDQHIRYPKQENKLPN